MQIASDSVTSWRNLYLSVFGLDQEHEQCFNGQAARQLPGKMKECQQSAPTKRHRTNFVPAVLVCWEVPKDSKTCACCQSPIYALQRGVSCAACTFKDAFAARLQQLMLVLVEKVQLMNDLSCWFSMNEGAPLGDTVLYWFPWVLRHFSVFLKRFSFWHGGSFVAAVCSVAIIHLARVCGFKQSLLPTRP